MFIAECRFCREGKDFSVAKERLGEEWPYENDVVYHDDNIYAIIGASPQVVPYILVLPYRHIFSMAEMSAGELSSARACMEYLCGRGGFGEELCIFEHGGRSDIGSSSIDHCHIHVIDGKYGLYEDPKFDGFEKRRRVEEVTDYADKRHYLLVGKFSKEKDEMKVAPGFIASETQYFRRRLAEILGEKEWDWRKDYRMGKMIETMKGFL